MSYCWYCYWGWPEQVAAIYDRWCARVGYQAMHFGPAHIVWEDENFETESIDSCIKLAADERAKLYKDMTDAELTGVVESLKELLAIPEEIRACEPEAFRQRTVEESHLGMANVQNPAKPEDYPPPAHIKMVQR
jgi:hypothetical protein